MKKIIALLILMVLLIPSIFAKDGLSVGGSLDVGKRYRGPHGQTT